VDSIRTEFDPDIDAYIVSLPNRISLAALRTWGSVLLAELEGRSGKTGLLFDSNRHDFESIDCLKWLKAFFTGEDLLSSRIDRVAFVQPPEYRSPEIVGESEAYFAHVEDAKTWLRACADSVSWCPREGRKPIDGSCG
jgi:hypothetical protein